MAELSRLQLTRPFAATFSDLLIRILLFVTLSPRPDTA